MRSNLPKPNSVMNTATWIVQGFLALVFLYSGVMKSSQSEQRLVAIGQTGVEGLPLPLIRFIGISEVAGALALIVPELIRVAPVLTPVSAVCLGAIMPPAALIHARRHEWKAVLFNGFVLLLCIWVAYERF